MIRAGQDARLTNSAIVCARTWDWFLMISGHLTRQKNRTAGNWDFTPASSVKQVMPFVPKVSHLFKILFKRQDPKIAEELWFKGSLLADEGDEEGARLAFRYACLFDKNFGGAYWNYAALTEKKLGNCKETRDAWKAYITAAENDSRQARDNINKVRHHLADLEKSTSDK